MTFSQQLMDTLTRFGNEEGSFRTAQDSIAGVAHTVFVNAPNNLGEMFQCCLLHDELPFIVYEQERLSFAEVYRQASALAAALVQQYKVKKGQRVALAMRNYPEWMISYMAITSIGAICVPLNAWWEADELAYGLEDCGASVFIADEPRIARVAGHLASEGLPLIGVRLGDTSHPELQETLSSWERLMAAFDGEPMPSVDVCPDDSASILYTSGSTGHPKGALSSHRAVLTTILQWAAVGEAVTEVQGESAIVLDHQAATLLTIPLFHVTGCNSLFLLSMIAGRKVVIMHKWLAEDALELIEREQVSSFFGVPTMSLELMQAAARSDRDLSSLKDIQAGGAARPPEQVAALSKTFADAKPTTGYGLTETNGLGALLGDTDYLQRPSSVGFPTAPMVSIKLLDEEGGDVPQGERGEIMIKSAANIQGYWNKPEATKQTLKNGWLATGDIGEFDAEGFLYIVDRKKDIIIRGGENISCIDVESVLFSCPSVQEAAVFGIPDERLGEVVVAVVMPKPGEVFTESVLREFLKGRLAGFKIPKIIIQHLEKLPRVASGKISKRQLKEEFLAQTVN